MKIERKKEDLTMMDDIVQERLISNLLFAYRDLKGLADIILMIGNNQPNEVDPDDLSTIQEINNINNSSILTALHTSLVGENYFEEAFKESVEEYLRHSDGQCDAKKFLSHMDFYVRRYKP